MRPLLVLRPEPGASETAARAAALGLEAIAAPLFEIVPVAPDWSGVTLPPDALLLTSANAARTIRHPSAGWDCSLRRVPRSPDGDPSLRWDDGRGLADGNDLRALPVYAVGAATAAAARAAGFRVVKAGEGDAAAIVARAAADGVQGLLHLAGREHRDVTRPGVSIDPLIVYASEAASVLPTGARAALDAGGVGLLHSPRAAGLFARLVAAASLDRSALRIAALSPAVAAAAGPGWAATATADRPTDAALLAVAARLCE